MPRREPLRLLMVEDDPARAERVRGWLPPGVRVVVSSSAGQAIGVLKRDRGRTYAGILLDHDLNQRPATAADAGLSGQDVVGAVLRGVDRAVPILVHSMNPGGSRVMARTLDRAGFEVQQVPMADLTRDLLLDWLAYVRELQEE